MLDDKLDKEEFTICYDKETLIDILNKFFQEHNDEYKLDIISPAFINKLKIWFFVKSTGALEQYTIQFVPTELKQEFLAKKDEFPIVICHLKPGMETIVKFLNKLYKQSINL